MTNFRLILKFGPMRKLIFLTLFTLIYTVSTNAQNWGTDFEKAKEQAKSEHKPIILVFQGSDWCAPCIKLDREIWRTEVFKTYSDKNYVMLKADFPRKKDNQLSEKQTEANAELAKTYNKNGFFPFVVVLDEKGQVLGEMGYKKTTPESYIKSIDVLLN